MKFQLLTIILTVLTSSIMIFDFNSKSDISKWRVVDDVVMGGRSSGDFRLNAAGNGEFSGAVSLENNGGFSSVRYRFKKGKIAAYTKFILRVKGDGKKYQFRVKSDAYDYHSYIANIQTDGTWQTIEVLFSEMYPAFRGRDLDMDNYPGKKMEEIAFLIGNKKREKFKIEIDNIALK